MRGEINPVQSGNGQLTSAFGQLSRFSSSEHESKHFPSSFVIPTSQYKWCQQPCDSLALSLCASPPSPPPLDDPSVKQWPHTSYETLCQNGRRGQRVDRCSKLWVQSLGCSGRSSGLGTSPSNIVGFEKVAETVRYALQVAGMVLRCYRLLLRITQRIATRGAVR